MPNFYQHSLGNSSCSYSSDFGGDEFERRSKGSSEVVGEGLCYSVSCLVLGLTRFILSVTRTSPYQLVFYLFIFMGTTSISFVKIQVFTNKRVVIMNFKN